MDDHDTFEPDTHVFTGTVLRWQTTYGELMTDSGVTIPLVTRGQPELPKGMRVTIRARKYRPRYAIEQILKADPTR